MEQKLNKIKIIIIRKFISREIKALAVLSAIIFVSYMGISFLFSQKKTAVGSTNITVSGTVFDTDESTALTSQPSMQLSVNGAAASTTSAAADGTFSFTNVSVNGPGDIITIWLDTAGADQASYVLKYGTYCTSYPDCTGLSLSKNRVVLDSENTDFMYNTDLSACDNDTGAGCADSDIGFTANSGDLSLTWSSNELKIIAETTFEPQGDVTAKKISIIGTYLGDEETLTLSGNGTSAVCTSNNQMPMCISGTFTPKLDTVNFTATSDTDIPGTTYYNLGIGTTSDTQATEYTVADDLTVEHVATIGNSSSTATDTLNGGSATITFAGSGVPMDITAHGAFDGGSGTVVYAGPIAKVAAGTYNNLTTGNLTPFAVEDSNNVTQGNYNPDTSFLDQANGFYYVVTSPFQGPAKIFKVRTSDFSVVATLSLESDEYKIGSSVIDTINGFAYLGTNHDSNGLQSPSIIKINLKTFSRVGRLLTAGAGEDYYRTAFIDAPNGFAYFVTAQNTSTISKIVKIQLSDFTKAGTLTLNTRENFALHSAIDQPNQLAYIPVNGGIDGPKVVKVDLSTFTRVGALVLVSGDPSSARIAIDQPNQLAYLGSNRTVKIDLSTFTRVGQLTLNSGEGGEPFIDQANQVMYEVAGSSMKFTKIDLSTFTRVSNFNTVEPVCGIDSGAFDEINGIIYYGDSCGDDEGPGSNIGKYKVSDSSEAIITGSSSTNSAQAILVDGTNGFIYLADIAGYNGLPGIIYKYKISDMSLLASLRLDGSLTSFLRSGAAIDIPNQFAYFLHGSTPAKIIKVDLSDFSTVTTLTLGAGEAPNSLGNSMVLDQSNQILYVGLNTTPGKIAKIDLSTFTESTPLTLTTANKPDAGTLDSTNGFLYYGSDESPAKIVKVRTSDFTEISTLTLNSGQNKLYAAGVDSTHGFAYFGTYTSPGQIIKLDLSSFTVNSSLVLDAGEDDIAAGIVTPSDQIGYFGTNTFPSIIDKVDLASMTKLDEIDLTDPYQMFGSIETAALDTVNGFVYFAGPGEGFPIFRVDANNDLTLGASSGQTIVVNGDFVNDSNLDTNAGTVEIAGSGTSTISGNEITFQDFTSTASGKTIEFQAGNTYTFNGSFNLQGSSGNNIVLQSDTGSSQWLANFSSAQTSSFLSVQDSGCDPSSQNITLTNSTDNLNNGSCWVFSASSNNNPDAPTSLGSANLVDGSTGSDNTPTLTFTLSDPDVADTVKFRIQIDDTSDFSSPVVDYTSALAAQGAASFTVGQAAGSGSYTVGSNGQTLPDQSYYWRVKAIDNSAAESAYTTANGGAVAFIVDTSVSPPPPPPSPTPTPPPSGGSTVIGGMPPTPAPVVSPQPSPQPVPTPTPNPPPVSTGGQSNGSKLPPCPSVLGANTNSKDTINGNAFGNSPDKTNPGKDAPKTDVNNGNLKPVGNAKIYDSTDANSQHDAEITADLVSIVTSSTTHDINSAFVNAISDAREIRRDTILASDEAGKDQSKIIKQANDDFKEARELAREARDEAFDYIENPPQPPLTPTPVPTSKPTPTPTPTPQPTPQPSVSPTNPECIPATTENPPPSEIEPTPAPTPVPVPPQTETEDWRKFHPEIPNGASGDHGIVDGWNDFVSNVVAEVYSVVHPTVQDFFSHPADASREVAISLPGGQKTLEYLNPAYAVGFVPFTPFFAPVLDFLGGPGSLYDLWLIILRSFSNILIFLGLKRKRQYWGTVYDSNSKQPLDPVLVTLYDAETHKKVDQAITDLYGRYGFLVLAGRFVMDAKKAGYKFPSLLSGGEKDQIFDHLYHGEVIEINDKDDLVVPNIPMDSLGYDFNQQAKKSIIHFHPFRDWIFDAVLKVLFWVGVLTSIISALAHPGPITYAVLAAYIILIIVYWLWPGPRLLGKLIDFAGDPLPGYTLQLTDESLHGVMLGKSLTDAYGKFFLKARPGQYTLNILAPEQTLPVKNMAVTVSEKGVLNKEIEVD